jgi:hypothetical protein
LNPRPLVPVASKLTTTPPRGPIVFINNIKQSSFVMKCCFLSGTDWILKYYLHEHRLQKWRSHPSDLSVFRTNKEVSCSMIMALVKSLWQTLTGLSA